MIDLSDPTTTQPPTPASLLPLAFRLFLQPLPVWDVWYLLALPLGAGVATVYKSIRAKSMRRVPWEATRATLWILLGLGGAAFGLLAVVRFVTWMGN